MNKHLTTYPGEGQIAGLSLSIQDLAGWSESTRRLLRLMERHGEMGSIPVVIRR